MQVSSLSASARSTFHTMQDRQTSSVPLPESRSIQTVLLDIEGTTTPIDFVYKVLFPFASEQVGSFLRRHAAEPQIRQVMADLKAQQEKDGFASPAPKNAGTATIADVEEVAAYARRLMSRDVKVAALKTLQGRIWQEGYQRRDLRGQVYRDVPSALQRWRGQGKKICIYSSGSVLAQQLLFRNSTEGDLTPLIDEYFDLEVGGKREPDSYRQIAGRLGLKPEAVAFLSDVVNELEAAREAGMNGVLVVRAKDEQPTSVEFPVVRGFGEVWG
jgi:enolase-phosphatase E1